MSFLKAHMFNKQFEEYYIARKLHLHSAVQHQTGFITKTRLDFLAQRKQKT